LWGIVLALISVAYDAMGLGFAVYERRAWNPRVNATFHPPVLAGFRTLDREYVEFLNDGFALLEQHRRNGETVMSLDFSNPFSYALGIPPAPGGAITLHYATNVTEAHHPPAEALFGQADLVMSPKRSKEPRLRAGIDGIYRPYLESHFHLIGESGGWQLYRRDR
jgi:hypothetical protein